MIERYPLEELIDIAQNSTSLFGDDFADIDGIGPEKSAKFINWFHDADNRAHVAHLLPHLVIEKQEPIEKVRSVMV